MRLLLSLLSVAIACAQPGARGFRPVQRKADRKGVAAAVGANGRSGRQAEYPLSRRRWDCRALPARHRTAIARALLLTFIGWESSVDPLYNRGEMTTEAYARLFSSQRRFLGTIAASSPLFLVNGNHEQAAGYLLNGTPSSPPVFGRNRPKSLLPQPGPGCLL